MWKLLQALADHWALMLQTTNGALETLKEWGPWGVLAWMVGDRAIPALVKLMRPEQERRLNREKAEQDRLREFEMRQLHAWEQVAAANNQLASSITQLSSAMASIDQRSDAMHASMVILLERTMGCEARRVVPKTGGKEGKDDPG